MSADIRQNGMKIPAWVVVAAIVLLSACSEGGTDESAQPRVSASEGGAPMASTPPAQPSGPAATPRADPDNPQDLIGPTIVITGTVTTTGGCTFLDTGPKRWKLVGDKAKQLRAGSRVTVRGSPRAALGECRADYSMLVIAVS